MALVTSLFGTIVAILLVRARCPPRSVSHCRAHQVIYIAPPAGGGGVPDVIGYLNGVNIPKVRSLRAVERAGPDAPVRCSMSRRW